MLQSIGFKQLHQKYDELMDLLDNHSDSKVDKFKLYLMLKQALTMPVLVVVILVAIITHICIKDTNVRTVKCLVLFSFYSLIRSLIDLFLTLFFSVEDMKSEECSEEIYDTGYEDESSSELAFEEYTGRYTSPTYEKYNEEDE